MLNFSQGYGNYYNVIFGLINLNLLGNFFFRTYQTTGICVYIIFVYSIIKVITNECVFRGKLSKDQPSRYSA